MVRCGYCCAEGHNSRGCQKKIADIKMEAEKNKKIEEERKEAERKAEEERLKEERKKKKEEERQKQKEMEEALAKANKELEELKKKLNTKKDSSSDSGSVRTPVHKVVDMERLSKKALEIAMINVRWQYASPEFWLYLQLFKDHPERFTITGFPHSNASDDKQHISVRVRTTPDDLPFQKYVTWHMYGYLKGVRFIHESIEMMNGRDMATVLCKQNSA